MTKTSMKERNKAIRLAWEREQQLVREGKATRDWTEKQQKDILNPDKGKAYDDQGRAFVGQHMKSAAKYPEYQGNPDNIQFLTYDEHLDAHKGNWQNPTNWYYDPVTKEFHEFGDGELVSCKIIDLNNPVVVLEASEQKAKATSERTTAKSDVSTTPLGPAKVSKPENGFIKGLKSLGRFIVNHPVESLAIAGTVIVGGIELVSNISGSRNTGTSSKSSNPVNGITDSSKMDIAAKVADIVEKATRAENDVTGHKQRYHTKDGVVWKDKAPYHRGGKDG